MKTPLTLIAVSLLLAGCCTTKPFVQPQISPIPASKLSPVKPLTSLESGTLEEIQEKHLLNMEKVRQLVIDREAVRRMLEARGLLAEGTEP